MAETTLYEILELSPGAASDEIKAAYRQLSTQVHRTGGAPMPSSALFAKPSKFFPMKSDAPNTTGPTRQT